LWLIYTSQSIRRIGKSHGIAAVRLFLVSDEASYVCGAESTADGGSSIGRHRDALPKARSGSYEDG
jgi:3alpha(or 20beta)-hydroxysteroid dehydrogenase